MLHCSFFFRRKIMRNVYSNLFGNQDTASTIAPGSIGLCYSFNAACCLCCYCMTYSCYESLLRMACRVVSWVGLSVVNIGWQEISVAPRIANRSFQPLAETLLKRQPQQQQYSTQVIELHFIASPSAPARQPVSKISFHGRNVTHRFIEP